MPVKDEPLGTIDISSTTITTIASQAINQCYGVVGMANKNLVNGIANLLSRESRRGIEVSLVDDEIVIRPMMYVALSYDHRIVDGREAVTFLKRVKELVESPERMIMEI